METNISFENLFKVVASKKYQISKKEYLESGEYPIVDQGQKFIVGYSNNEDKLYSLAKPIIIFGDHTRIIKYIDFDFIIGADGTKVLTVEDNILPKYAYYQLLYTRIENLGYSRHFKLLKEKLFQKHPLEKQKQIAKTLDKAQELIDLQKESISKLDELSKSLFIDMFGDPVSNPKGWEIKEIRDLIVEAKYGTSEKSSIEKKEYPVLRMNNLTYEGYLNTDSLKYMDMEEKDKKKYLVQNGDLLFNRTNSKELVGKTVIYNLDTPMAYAGYLIRVRTENLATNVYICAFLNSKVGKQLLFNMCKSIVGMANINAQELQNIKIAKPPIDLQKSFAKKIEKIEEQKNLYELELEKLQYNFDALLAKSFQG